MGIKSLTKFLKDKYSSVFEPVHISEYAYKRVAIDISLYIFTYKRAFTPPDTVDKNTLISKNCSWLGAFIKLIAVLRENEVHCVFIYDSKATNDKDVEKERRKTSHQNMRERYYKLAESLEHYHQTGEIDSVLTDFQEKRKIPTATFLGTAKSVNISGIETLVNNMKKQLVKITDEDFNLTKKLFDILNVPYYTAPVEAETTCSDLCKRGLVDAVLSEDTDVLAYGSPVFLTKINTAEQSFLRIRFPELLKEMNYTPEQFLDFCIMCGTDYNSNIFKVGPIKSYQLISEKKTIDEIKNYDISVLNHVRVRELFTEYTKVDWQIPYCGQPDFEKLIELLEEANLRIDIESLRKSFVHNVVVFEE